MGFPDSLRRFQRSSQGVEHVALCVFVQQRLRLVLSMQVDHESPHGRQSAGGHRNVVGPGPALSACGHFPSQEEEPVLDFDASLFEHRLERGVSARFEDPFHDRAVRAGADDVGAAPLTQEQA